MDASPPRGVNTRTCKGETLPGRMSVPCWSQSCRGMKAWLTASLHRCDRSSLRGIRRGREQVRPAGRVWRPFDAAMARTGSIPTLPPTDIVVNGTYRITCLFLLLLCFCLAWFGAAGYAVSSGDFFPSTRRSLTCVNVSLVMNIS